MGKIATCDHFRMGDYLVLGAAGAAPFVATEVGATGATHLAAVGGVYNLNLDATNEAQILCLSMGDVLRYDIDDLIRIEFIAGITSASLTGITAVIGLGSARNDTADTVAANAWFRFQGSFAALMETDDGTTDTDDKATGQTLVTAVLRRFAIDFSVETQTVSPPGTSKKGKANVHFYMDDANGYLKRVGQAQLFDMNAYTSGLQFLAQIQKASGTTLGTLHIKDVKVEHKLVA